MSRSPQEHSSPKSEETLPFESTVRDFSRRIEAHRDSFRLLLAVLEELRNVFGKSAGEFLRKHGRPVHAENQEPQEYELPPERLAGFASRTRRSLTHHTALEILPRQLIVALVSHLDALLSSSLRCAYSERPDLLRASDQSLKYIDIATCASVDAIASLVVDKELDALGRMSFPDKLKHLGKTRGLKVPANYDHMSEYIELTERRNLFVHAEGRVSSQYLSICRSVGYAFDATPQVGEELTVTPKYFLHACRTTLARISHHVMGVGRLGQAWAAGGKLAA